MKKTNDWKEMGLMELGLTTEEYEKLAPAEKEDIDKCLMEMGHA